MNARRRTYVAAGVLVAALSAGGAWAACDDPNPTHCPPPSCQGCELTRSTLAVSPVSGQKGHGARARRIAWLLLALRTVAGAARCV